VGIRLAVWHDRHSGRSTFRHDTGQAEPVKQSPYELL